LIYKRTIKMKRENEIEGEVVLIDTYFSDRIAYEHD
jgi:hypothetical protein